MATGTQGGMVLCCFDKDDTKLELLTPPADAAVGERIVVDLPSVEDTHLPSTRVEETQRLGKASPRRAPRRLD